MKKETIGKALLIFVLAFNGIIALAAFVVPQFYFLNPAVIGEYSGVAILTWGAITVTAIILGSLLANNKDQQKL